MDNSTVRHFFPLSSGGGEGAGGEEEGVFFRRSLGLCEEEAGRQTGHAWRVLPHMRAEADRWEGDRRCGRQEWREPAPCGGAMR